MFKLTREDCKNMGKYVLFGAGEYGKSCLELLGENKVKCFVDNDPKSKEHMLKILEFCLAKK